MRTLFTMIVHLCVLMLAAGTIGSAQTPRTDSAAERNRRWAVDVDYLASELPRRHVKLFHDLDRPAFERQLVALRSDIPRSSDADLTTRLMRIVAAVRDGHTSVDYAPRLRTVPIQLGWFPEGVVVTQAAPEQSWLVGARVLRVGGVPLDSVFALASALVSREPSAEEKVRLEAPFIMQFPALLNALAIGPPDSLILDLRMVDGRERHVNLPAAMTRQQWLGMWSSSARHDGFIVDADPAANYWSRLLAKDRSLYIRYSFCGDGRPPFAEFSQSALATIDSADLRRVIIDLRGNAGGNSKIIQPLIKGLSARQSMHKAGAIIVLMDRGTYSSAILNATQLRLELGAVYVGEAPGGAPWHYGEVETLTLPNSELRISYPTKIQGVGPQDMTLIRPDFVVIPAIDDFLTTHDAILAAALQLRAPER